MIREPEPEGPPALVLAFPKPPRSVLIGVVQEMHPSLGALGWPPPEDDEPPSAA